MRETLAKHNGLSNFFYSSIGKVYELKNLNEFNSAMSGATGRVMAVCYHNGSPTAEEAWNLMKKQFPNVHMYKVNTLNSNDIKDKYADGSSKPYFKFYRNFKLDSEVKYMSNWDDHQPKVRAVLENYNGNPGLFSENVLGV